MSIDSNELIVVGIGASAGGLASLKDFFKNVKPNSNLAFVIIQHLSEDFESLMSEILQPITDVKVETATDGMVLLPNHVYLNSGSSNLLVKNGKFVEIEREPKGKLNLPIDLFFNSIAEEFKENAIGVVLSGTGTDGTKGIETIKANGGLVLVESPETAEFDGMPNSAILTRLVDAILAPAEIVRHIYSYYKKSNELEEGVNPEDEFSEKDILDILRHIEIETGVDLRNYKRGTIRRRLLNRLLLHGSDSFMEYKKHILSDEIEIASLLDNFLINVTSFFRDSEAFDLIEHVVIPKIVDQKKNENSIRIWIAGCSSGQEAYSIAMLLDRYITRNKLGLQFKVYATDLDLNSLSTANAGLYDASIENEIPDDLLAEFFNLHNGGYQVVPKIRSKVVFSRHNLLEDPPFMNMDLVMCRNLLIYFNLNAQQQAIGNIQFSLKNKGFLVLGSSESLGILSKYFSTIDNKWKIYQNTAEVKYLPRSFDPKTFSKKRKSLFGEFDRSMIDRNKIKKAENNQEVFYHKILSNKFAPDCLILDIDYNILFINGKAGEKLRFRSGVFDRNLLKLIPDELVTLFKAPVRKVLSDDDANDVLVKDVPIEREGKDALITLVFSKYEINNISDPFILIEFSEDLKFKPGTIEINALDSEALASEHIGNLEKELQETKEKLQTLVEQLETSNEELQSSNEELTTTNEELQSTNEELQSVNEELVTVNHEFQMKNKELLDVNDDIRNLLESTEIGTLYLDRELLIRKFTPGLKEIVNITDADIGRSVTDFNMNFEKEMNKEVLDFVWDTLEKEETHEIDIIDKNGRYHLCKIIPFKTLDKSVDGVVLTFVDVTRLKEIEAELSKTSYELEKAQRLSKIGSWHLELDTSLITWSKGLYEIFELDVSAAAPKLVEQKDLYDEETWEVIKETIEHALKTGESYEKEFKLNQKRFPDGWIRGVGEAIFDEDGNITGLRGIAQDITDQKRVSRQFEKGELFNKRVTESVPMGIYIYNLESGNNEFINPHYEQILGYTKEELNEMTQEEFMDLFHPDDTEAVLQHMNKIMGGETEVPIEYRFKHKDLHWVWCYSVDSPFEFNNDGSVKNFIGVFIDVTEKKKLELELNEIRKNNPDELE